MNLPSRFFAAGAEEPDLFWRLLHYFNVYRIALCGFFLLAILFTGDKLIFGAYDPALFRFSTMAYFLAGLAFIMPISRRRPDFDWQLSFQVSTDIVAVVLFIHASGGLASGLGLLLLVSLAASGLLRGLRMMFFFVSVASIALLLEHTWDVLQIGAPVELYLQAGMLSIGYFLMAALLRALAVQSRESDRLARERGRDLVNLAQINQLVIEDMQDGVLIVDEAGKLLSRNPRAELMFSLENQEEPVFSRCCPQLARQIERHAGSEIPDIVLALKDGRKVNARFVRVEKSGSFVVYLEDLSRIQEEARQLKLAALGRLTANIAHEIRNPLSSISYATELLLEEPAPGQERLLQIIRDNTLRLDSMVKDVLQLNRRDRANAERIEPQKFLSNFVEDFCKIQKVPSAAFVLQIEADAAFRFDRSHFNQIMWNLCRNAWRHCRQQEGSIRIAVLKARARDRVIVDVRDDGEGVPAELMSQLFEPFFTTAESGTGLGLYIAREIAHANGASMDYLEEEAGAHFRLICRSYHAA